MGNAHLGNIAFWVSDFDAARAFYVDLLGLEPLHEGDRPRNWAFFGNEFFTWSINEAEMQPAEKGWARCPMNPALNEAWDPYITIYVDDLAGTLERCRDAGVEVRQSEPFSLGEGFRFSSEVRDPDGNTIALTQR